MRLEIMGPPGAGKGTQARRLAAAQGVPHISTGDMFRDNIRHHSELGRKAQEYLQAGNLVPDDLVSDMVRDRLAHEDCRDGYLLDGYPRTAAQVRDLDRILSQHDWTRTAVLLLEVPEEELVRRIASRRVCEECGRNFRAGALPEDGVCASCGGALLHRGDDREDVVRERLQVYRRETEPVLAIYRERGILRPVDGQGEVDEIFERLLRALDEAA